LAEKDAANRDYRHEWGVARNNLGNLLAEVPSLARRGCETDLERAEVEHVAAVQLFTKLRNEAPGVPVYRQELANSYNSLGTVLAWKSVVPLPARAAGLAGYATLPSGSVPYLMIGTFLAGSTRQWSQAQRTYERAETILVRLVKDHQKVPEYKGDLGMTYGNLGWLLTEQQKWAEARAPLDKAITWLRPAVEPKPPNPTYQKALRNQYQTLAETALQMGDHAAAANAATELPRVFGDRSLDYYYAACYMARCVPLTRKAALRRGYAARAVGLLRSAAARGVSQRQRLPDLEKAYLAPLGPEAVAALADLDARRDPPEKKPAPE
jgi:tetratricopeptide (TPR) repeat protein